MNKSIFKTMIIFSFIFCNYSPVWSMENIHYEKINLNYHVDQSLFLSMDKSFLSISESINPCNKNDWLYSILLPGLGQIKMGDQIRGLKFSFLEAGMIIISLVGLIIYNLTGINQSNVNTPRNPATIYFGIGASIIGAISILFLPFIHLWNILDSLSMSKECLN